MSHWVQASRPLAQVNIALPLLLGQAAAWHVERIFSMGWLAAGLGWGVIDHLFVIFANDFADRHADTEARTPISGGSGVIPEGKIPASAVKRAAAGSAVLLFLGSCALALFGRPWLPAYAVLAILLLWLYSFPPARLSYRGGGEVLQGAGLGVVLPCLGYYLQTQQLLAPWWVVAPAFVLGVSGNILTAIPDIEVDRRARKHTWAVRHGVSHARRAASAGIAFAAFGVFLWTPDTPPAIRASIGVAPLVPLLAGARARSPLSAAWWASLALQSLLVLWCVALVFSAEP